MASDYTNVLRPATSDEKKEFIEVKPSRKLPYKEVKMRKIRDAEKKFHSMHKPYDRYSALLDLEDSIETFIKEYRRKVGSDREALEQELHNKDFFDDKKIESYGDIKRFEILDVKDIYTEKVQDGVKVPVQDRKEVVFKALERGNQICFQMYNQEYEQTYLNKKKEDKPSNSNAN